MLGLVKVIEECVSVGSWCMLGRMENKASMPLSSFESHCECSVFLGSPTEYELLKIYYLLSTNMSCRTCQTILTLLITNRNK